VARPTKLTPETRDRILQALRAGNHAEAACRAAGIATSTSYSWLDRGEREPDALYGAFAEAVRRAEAEAEVHAVAVVRRAMADDWRAALAYLERRHPARWRRQQVTELVGADGGPIRSASELDLTKLSDEDLRLLEEVHARAAAQE
jgi:transposase